MELLLFGLLLEAREDHPPRRRLQHAGHDDVHVSPDAALGVVHDDHGPVVQVGHPLSGFLPFLEHEHPDGLAGQHDRAQGVAQFIDVQHPDALQLRDLVQVQIVRDHLGPDLLGQHHDLGIHFLHVGEVVVHDPDVDVHHLLDLVQDVQAPAAARPLEAVRGIGDVLELVQNELGHQERALQKAGLAEVRHAPVDDHAGIKNLIIAGHHSVFRVLHRPCEPFHSEFGPQHDAEVGQPQEKQEPADMEQERLHVEDRAADPFDQSGQHQPDRQPGGPSDDDAERGPLQPVFGG